MATKKKQIKVTLVRSPITTLPKHKACLKGLGLRKMNQSVVLNSDPCILGMINKVNYLLSIEEV